MTGHTLRFGNDSDGLIAVPVVRSEEGKSEMAKLRELIGRFDRWTLQVFNPTHPPVRR